MRLKLILFSSEITSNPALLSRRPVEPNTWSFDTGSVVPMPTIPPSQTRSPDVLLSFHATASRAVMSFCEAEMFVSAVSCRSSRAATPVCREEMFVVLVEMLEVLVAMALNFFLFPVLPC